MYQDVPSVRKQDYRSSSGNALFPLRTEATKLGANTEIAHVIM